MAKNKCNVVAFQEFFFFIYLTFKYIPYGNRKKLFSLHFDFLPY
jgi:hypothetical protein